MIKHARLIVLSFISLPSTCLCWPQLQGARTCQWPGLSKPTCELSGWFSCVTHIDMKKSLGFHHTLHSCCVFHKMSYDDGFYTTWQANLNDTMLHFLRNIMIYDIWLYYEYIMIGNVVSVWWPVCALHLEAPRQVAFLSHFGVRQDTDCQVAMAAVPFAPSHVIGLYGFELCQISGLSFPCCRHDCLCMRWTLHMYHMPRPCLTLPYLRCQQIAILLHYHGTAWMVGSKLSSFFRLEASFGAGLSMEHDKLLQWASQVPRVHVM